MATSSWIDTCIEFLETWEDVRLEAYQCSAGVWTLGLGTTRYPDGPVVWEGDTCTMDDAYDYCAHYLTKKSPYVKKAIKNPEWLEGDKFAAVMSLVYNIGLTAFKNSTVLKRINNQDDEDSIREAWGWWNKAGGKKVRGLVNRRRAELILAFGS